MKMNYLTKSRPVVAALSLLLLSSLCLIMPGALAGTPYQTAVGNPPVVTSLAWKTWEARLIAFRLNECPIPRATTYYFSQSGNDGSGNGTQATPYKTIAKANALLQASSGNIALLFKRGDVWQREQTTYNWVLQSTPATGQATVVIAPMGALYPRAGDAITLTGGTSETLTVASYVNSTYAQTVIITFTTNITQSGHTGANYTTLSSIDITKPNCTIGAWGANGSKPRFDAFGGANYKLSNMSNAAARGDSYGRTYSISETNPVAWVRENGDSTNIFRKVASIAQVDSNPGSWWQDTTSNIVYMHDFDDCAITSSGRLFYPVYSNYVSAIAIEDIDGTRIDNIRIDGYGAKSGISGANYAIKGLINGTNSAVISNCEVYYSDNHCIGVLGGAYAANTAYIANTSGSMGGGGQITYIANRAGLCTNNDTPFVCYNQQGGQEGLLVENECIMPLCPNGLQTSQPPQPFTEHAAPIGVPSYSTGQPVLVMSDIGSRPNVPFVAGQALTLTGGTNETLTVQSYVPSTGTLTFTSNIANAGHTGFTFSGGLTPGMAAQYQSGLCLMYGNRNVVGRYQSAGTFGGSQQAPIWTDLVNCRSWDVGEVFDARPRVTIDENPQIVQLTPGSQTSTTATVTLPASLGTYPNNLMGQWVFLSGGGSAGEWIQIGGNTANADTGTGIITFKTSIVGSSRTEMRINIGRVGYSYNWFAANNATAYTAIVNGKFYNRIPWNGSNGGGTSLVNGNGYPGASNVFINCSIINDFSEIGDTGSPNQLRSCYNYPTGSGAPTFYNCRIHNITASRDLSGFDGTPTQGGSVGPIKAYNCLFTANCTANGNAVVGIGNVATNQSGNAYAGFTSKTGTPGYSNDPYAVELGYVPLFSHPDASSPLIVPAANQQLIYGTYRLEYDADWVPRSLTTPAIGCYESIGTATTVSGTKRKVQ